MHAKHLRKQPPWSFPRKLLKGQKIHKENMESKKLWDNPGEESGERGGNMMKSEQT